MVERITFQNPENGFTVARLAPERLEAEEEAARGEDRRLAGSRLGVRASHRGHVGAIPLPRRTEIATTATQSIQA